MLYKSDGDSLRSGFLRSVDLHSSAPAIVASGRTISYAEINQVARQWAQCIIELSELKPQRVGIFAYRSDVAYIGTIAALMAGAAFVPLNPTFPPEKTAAMASMADLDAIIVDRNSAAKVPSVFAGLSIPAILVPEIDSPSFANVDARMIGRDSMGRYRALLDLPPITPEDTAYLLFTSGSTGAPKGVPVTHGNAVHFVRLMSKRYRIRSDDRFSQTFDQTFDLSVFDMFVAWFNGACIYAISPIELLAPTSFVNRHELSIWFSVPSVAIQMIKRGTLRPDSLASLRCSLFCGEPLECRVAQAWQAAAPNAVLENLYGPTELTIACFAYKWDADVSPDLCRNGYVPIGLPLEGLAACVLKEDSDQMVNDGPGELAVCGPQTTPGYWDNAEQTRLKFVSLPVSAHESRRFYRTGDRVTRLSEGPYVFLGRTDQQIKVLGHRVELGEVEAVLRRGSRVEYAVALGWPPFSLNAEGVVAFVSGTEIDLEELKHLAISSLPPYMVPRSIHFRQEMPLNANGKVDRNWLRQDLIRSGGAAS